MVILPNKEILILKKLYILKIIKILRILMNEYKRNDRIIKSQFLTPNEIINSDKDNDGEVNTYQAPIYCNIYLLVNFLLRHQT